jgi:hypothetical protein
MHNNQITLFFVGERKMLILAYIISFLFTLKLIQLGYQYRRYIGEMGGMALAMSLSMVNGLLTGEIAAHIYVHNLFAAMLIGMIIGSGLGFVAGTPFGILAVLDGVLSGVMGGMMGAMLGMMLPNSKGSVLTLLIILEIVVFLLFFAFMKRKVTFLRFRAKKHVRLRRIIWRMRAKIFK